MKHTNKITLTSLGQLIFRTQLTLIITLASFLGVTGIVINMHFETQKRDQNLQNIAQTIANSPILTEYLNNETNEILKIYIDSLMDSLSNIDVISVVNFQNQRIYHSNHSLIGTIYDGTPPKFNEKNIKYYTTNDKGPSGNQRRAYAAIYDKNGTYTGFVMTIILMENIREEALQTLFLYVIITIVAILIEIMISTELSKTIKTSLMGYEPSIFSAMYQIRDNILESLEEGIIAVDNTNQVLFMNTSSTEMLKDNENKDLLLQTLNTTEKEFHIQNEQFGDILIDKIPIKETESNTVIGTVGILHNRAEYTKLMEDLTGTRYLVDSMRANNHDFTNKLHVILGLIQMEMYEQAISYIENISIVQRTTINKIINTINEPSIAALLIGKVARASELNVKFILRENCCYINKDINIPSSVLITIIGNLIDNAFEAMNQHEYENTKEFLFGIYSKKDILLITADDTGIGMSTETLLHIFENGYSTKGTNHGTGLYQVKNLVKAYGGTISVESQQNIGTSFSINFTKKK